jgi:outer membrane protein assembly factor BamB
VRRPSRRDVLRGCAVGTTALAGCSVFTPSTFDCSGDDRHEFDAPLSPAASWPSYQNDAANTGYAPDASGPDDPELAWRHSVCTSVDSGVVVHGGTVSTGGLLLDGRTGRRVGGEWGPHTGTPTVADGRLYVGDRDLLARDVETGDLDWTFEVESGAGGMGTPAVVDGTVYVRGHLDDPTVYAVDASTGRERWRVELDAAAWNPLAVANATVFVADDASKMYALDAATGDTRWTRSPAADVEWGTPVVGDGRLYARTGEQELVAFDAADGAEVWRHEVDAERIGAVAVADGTVFVAVSEGVRAVSASDGRTRWDWTRGPIYPGAPVVAGETVYVPADRTLYAVRASDGAERWRFETGSVPAGDGTWEGIADGVAVAGGTVYLATEAGDLYALAES